MPSGQITKKRADKMDSARRSRERTQILSNQNRLRKLAAERSGKGK